MVWWHSFNEETEGQGTINHILAHNLIWRYVGISRTLRHPKVKAVPFWIYKYLRGKLSFTCLCLPSAAKGCRWSVAQPCVVKAQVNPHYHSAPSQPRVTANTVMQVKSEVWVHFPESSFALKKCNDKPHLRLEGSTWPFFFFWEWDGDSWLHSQKELTAKRGPSSHPLHWKLRAVCIFRAFCLNSS